MIKSGALQTKLMMGKPGDIYEQEEKFIPTKELTGHNAEVIPYLESRIQAIGGCGQLLPESVRAYFKPCFGYDFS